MPLLDKLQLDGDFGGRSRVAALLGLTAGAGGAVNVKAKTNEGLDAVGRGEAIAATAVAVVARQRDRELGRPAGEK